MFNTHGLIGEMVKRILKRMEKWQTKLKGVVHGG